MVAVTSSQRTLVLISCMTSVRCNCISPIRPGVTAELPSMTALLKKFCASWYAVYGYFAIAQVNLRFNCNRHIFISFVFPQLTSFHSVSFLSRVNELNKIGLLSMYGSS